MSDVSDLDDLARRYLDLWQEHVEGLAHDRDSVDLMARTIAMMNAGATAFAAAADQRTGDAAEEENDHTDREHHRPDGPGGFGPGAAAAESAPGDPGAHLDELLGRIAALEERVALLENGGNGKSEPKFSKGNRTGGKSRRVR